LNGYREDDFKTYLYQSTDYGKNWKSVKGNLPESVANVIIQDPVNASLLYCGLDNGTYVSLDGGNNWHFFTNMLNVASYDMMVHPRENELIVGTHGRSVYVADVKPLQQLKGSAKDKAVVAFATDNVRYSERWGQKAFPWDKTFDPKATVLYYCSKPNNNLTIEITDEQNSVVRKQSATGVQGFNHFTWDLKIQKAAPVVKGKSKSAVAPNPELVFAGKGKYKIKFTAGTESSETIVEIK
jgi:hypothetical protein